jgi:hypothetical protein
MKGILGGSLVGATAKIPKVAQLLPVPHDEGAGHPCAGGEPLCPASFPWSSGLYIRVKWLGPPVCDWDWVLDSSLASAANIFFFWVELGFELLGSFLQQKVLYWLSYTSSLFCCGYFGDWV